MRSRSTGWAMLAALLFAVGAEAAVVRLRSAAAANGPLVTVGSVAEIEDADDDLAARLRAVELRPAPAPGETVWIEWDVVREQLLRAGFAPDRIELRGARRVEVAAPRTPPDEARSKTDERRGRIADMVKERVRAQGGWPEDRLALDVGGDWVFEWLEKNDVRSWELVVPRTWRLGVQPVTLEVAGKGGEGDVRRFTLHVYLKLEERVVVPTRAIPAGRTITPSDVTLARPTNPNDAETGMDDVAAVVGKEACRTLEAGKPIGRRDVKGTRLVQRGRPVTVWLRYNTAAVHLVATADDDGELGDWVEATNPTNRQKLPRKLRVIGPNTVEFTAAAPPAGAFGHLTQNLVPRGE